VEPLHHVGDLVVVSTVDSIPEIRLFKVISEKLIYSVFHGGERLAHHTGEGKTARISAEHADELNLLHGTHLVVGIFIKCALFSYGQSFESGSHINVRVVINLVEGASVHHIVGYANSISERVPHEICDPPVVLVV
jgi:hypothetical protein